MSQSSEACRKRTLTEKGKLYQVELLQEKRQKLQNQVRKKIHMMEKLFTDDKINELKASHEELCNQFKELLEVHGKCQVLIDANEREVDDLYVDQLDKTVYAFRKRVRSWLSNNDVESKDKVTSHHSEEKSLKSKRSSRSSKSSSRSSSRSLAVRVKEEKAKLAELEIEAAFLKRKQEAYVAAKQVDVEVEMAKATARLRIYESEEDDIKGDQSELDKLDVEDKQHIVQEYVTLHSKGAQRERQSREYVDNISLEEDKSSAVKPHLYTEQIRQVRKYDIGILSEREKSRTEIKQPKEDSGKITDLLRYLQAPDVEVDTFDGNALDFLFFMSSFVQAVETKVDDQRGCLTRLLKYLAGEPKELVKSCIYLPKDRCYREAKRLLFSNYGDPHRLLSEYRRQIKNWPKLKPNDSVAYREFHTFLIKFQSTMRYSGNDWFDSPELIQILHSKMPLFIQDRWNRQANKIRKKRNSEARLSDFMSLIEEEVNLVTDPLYSREAISNDNDKSSAVQKYDKDSRRKMKSFNTSVASELCPCCNLKHDLDDCVEYLRKSLEERRRFVFRKRLCFCCYKQTTSEHSAKTCKNRRQCKQCKGNHPTGLHGYKGNQENAKHTYYTNNDNVKNKEIKSQQSIVQAYTKLHAEVISLCVVPVKVTHKDCSKTILTHALLDNGSQGTFIKENLLQQLGITGISTSISIKTVNSEVNEQCTAVDGLCVSGIKKVNYITLPRAFTQKTLPVDVNEVPTPNKLKKWQYLNSIHSFIPQDDQNIKIDLLIGGNCPAALEPMEVIPSRNGGPYAFKSKLGWCVTGPIQCDSESKSPSKCNYIAANDISTKEVSPHFFALKQHVKDASLKDMLVNMYDQDFIESKTCCKAQVFSIEDEKFLKMMNKEVRFYNGHYELPLPFRNTTQSMPINREQVSRRTKWLKKKLANNTKMLSDYTVFMDNILQKGYAREAAPIESSWYIPHFGVYHPQKPDKIRVVFDCSAQFFGISINDHLMQGPNLTNQLVGVLIRFRQEEIAVMGDIESMFYQVRIPEHHYKFLRFLWWPSGNLDYEIKEYEMCVHLFGAISSPSCSNYAIKRTANDHETTFGQDAANTLRKNLYVDDLLKSYETPQKAICLLKDVQKMCAAGGFRLTKFVSNSKEVLNSIDDADKAKSLKSLDLSVSPLPVERALGVHWSIENDSFGFRIELKDTPLTRRGILSTISSVFDPLGLASPFLLPARQILQQLCLENKGWDENISEMYRNKWEQWRRDLPQLQSVSVQRCFKPPNFGKVKRVSVHHFSDASDQGYGQASYLRLESEKGQVSCNLVIGKARVAPIKTITIPRMELTAATLSIKVSKMLQAELDYKDCNEYYWTDSQVVLCYLNNEVRRYKVFVANRVSTILEHSKAEQWRHVPSSKNPADDASRGLSISKFLSNTRWFHGPKFLLQPEKDWPSTNINANLENLELKKQKNQKNMAVNLAKIHDEKENDLLNRLVQRTTKWIRLKRIIATVMRWRNKVRSIEIYNLQDAEIRILKLVQRKEFSMDMGDLEHESRVKKASRLKNLDPYLDKDGVIRVGGRISMSDLNKNIAHPIVLPKRNEVTEMIVKWCHAAVQHGGRGLTINEIRRCGYWVINCNSFVRYIISKCVTCRLLRGKTAGQKMADLPADRVNESPPFTYCGVDMFGPFVIKEGRKELKKYGALFTCMSSRAVHIESTNNMDTDSFILALRRFIARRGQIRLLRCDNGSNFIGAEAELLKSWKEMDQERISTYLQQRGADWIKWQHNPPKASHFGGIWERQIRSARAIISSLLKTHGQSLNDEAFRTLLTEVEAIINSRPLTTETLSDIGSPLPLSPVNLLTMKTKVILPPPGEFQQPDLYCRRRWRRVQHIANEFWSRWQKEYLQSLQSRTKWQRKQRNFRIDDIVLIKEENFRNAWSMARVIAAHPSKDHSVRSVELLTSTGQKLTRPIHKIVLLLENECGSNPRRGALTK